MKSPDHLLSPYTSNPSPHRESEVEIFASHEQQFHDLTTSALQSQPAEVAKGRELKRVRRSIYYDLKGLEVMENDREIDDVDLEWKDDFEQQDDDDARGDEGEDRKDLLEKKKKETLSCEEKKESFINNMETLDKIQFSQEKMITEINAIRRDFMGLKSSSNLGTKATNVDDSPVPPVAGVDDDLESSSQQKKFKSIDDVITLSEELSNIQDILDHCSSNWKKYEKEILEAVASIDQMLIGKWQSTDLADKDNFNRLKLLLIRISSCAGGFKGDPDALWIITPLLNLVSEILYTMAFYLLPAPPPLAKPKLLLDEDNADSDTTPFITSEVVAIETNTPECWVLENTSTQESIRKGSNIPFCLKSLSTGGYLEVQEGGKVSEFKIRKQSGEEKDDDGSSDIVYILCLDESGSMSGPPFDDLRAAYSSFISGIHENDGIKKRIAVINFDDQARFVAGPDPVPIASAPRHLDCQGGSTDFYPPMVLVGEVMSHQSCVHSTFQVLFMTDGEGNGPGDLVNQYVSQYGDRFILNSVGFGSNVNEGMLRTLTAGGGTYRNALTGQDLKNVFETIASESISSASPVWLWFENKGTAEQLWKYSKDGCLISQLNGYALDAEYANLITRPQNSGKNQRWNITKDGHVVSETYYLMPVVPKQKRKKQRRGDITEPQPENVSEKPLVTLNNAEKEELQKQLQEIEVQITTSENHVFTLVILDALSALSSMLVNHKKEVLSAVGLTFKGAFKTVMMRKLDQDLLNGVCKCVSAGFEVYKHYSADKQFTMIQQVKCPRKLQDPMWISYEQLVVTSQSMESVDGNWLLSSNYISHLSKSALLALRSFRQSPQQSTLMLRACINGDGCVSGINKLLRKATKKRTPSKSVSSLIHSTLLDAESLSDAIRQVVMEGMGEVVESVERISLDVIDECLGLFENLKENTTQYLPSMRYITNTLKSLQSWKDCFEKSISKVLKHLKGARKLFETITHYINIFHFTITPEEVDKRINQIFSQCRFDSLSFAPALQVLLNPPKLKSSSKLPGPIKDEIDQVIVLVGALTRIFNESEKSLKQVQSTFSGFKFPVADLEKYTSYKEKESSASVVSRTSTFFSKKPDDPAAHLQSAKSTLPEFKNAAISAQRSVEAKCSFFRFAIEIASKVEDLFFTASQFSMPELDNLKIFKPNVQSLIQESLKKTVCNMMSDLKNLFEGVGSGWWTSLSETWRTFSFTDAMGSIRNALPTLIGPGQYPERVEESALIAILELEMVMTQLWQSCTQSKSSSSTNESHAIDELSRLIETMRSTIAQAKASSSNSNIRLLLKQEKYREKVKYSVQESWQIIEDDVVLCHMEAFHSQECLRQKIHNCRDNGELSQLTGVIDTIHHTYKANDPIEKIEVTQEACEVLLSGKSGISGLARGLMIQLSHLKRQMELSIDDVTEIILTEDPRWGMEYNSGIQETQNIVLTLSCSHYPRVVPVYIPRSPYYIPKSHNTYNYYNIASSSTSHDHALASCPTCGGGRCPSCGGTSSSATSHPHPSPPSGGGGGESGRPTRSRPSSAGNGRSSRRGGGTPLDRDNNNAGQLFNFTLPSTGVAFDRANRFQRSDRAAAAAALQRHENRQMVKQFLRNG